MEELRVKHLVLLGEYEDDAPEVANQPSIDTLITAVRCDEDVGDLRKQALQ